MFDLEVFLYWFCYFNAICTKAIEMAAAEMPMVYRYYEKSRTSAADGISFRGCLSDDGDIFSKSAENQGGANRTFATGGRCHGWQLEPCPCGLEPLSHFSSENSHRETWHLGRMFYLPQAFVGVWQHYVSSMLLSGHAPRSSGRRCLR